MPAPKSSLDWLIPWDIRVVFDVRLDYDFNGICSRAFHNDSSQRMRWLITSYRPLNGSSSQLVYLKLTRMGCI